MAREPITRHGAEPENPAHSPQETDSKKTERPPGPSNPSLKRGKSAAPTVFSKPYGSQPAGIDPKTGLKSEREQKEPKPAA